MDTDIRGTNKSPLFSSNILAGNANGISEAAQTAIISNTGKVLAGGDITTNNIGRTGSQRPGSYDPYTRNFENIANTVKYEAPKVSVVNDKISISAPQSFFDSPIASQLKNELNVLKGANLSSPEVTNAINSLNEEIRNTYTNTMVEQTTGWTPEQFKDYQYAYQTVSGTNPMKSSNLIKGKDRYGEIQKKTPQEWINYYRSAYNTDDRADAFLASLESDDPYGRTMALVMSKGAENPIYGFDFWERVGQGASAWWNSMSKFPKGVARVFGTSNDVKRVEDLSKKLDIPALVLVQSEVKSEDAFEKMKEDIKGKTWKELSDVEKAFVLEVGVSRESSSTPANLRGMIGEERYYAKSLEDMTSSDDKTSRDAIDAIMSNNSYDEYKNLSDEYNKWQAWDEKFYTDVDERLAKNATWSGTEQNIGNFLGTIGRFLWENAVGEALTGFSMNKISDKLAGSFPEIVNGEVVKEGSGILGWLAKHGILPASRKGIAFTSFIANLVGTIPEDAVQTAVDNIVTNNADDNSLEKLFSGEELSTNLKNNIIWMSLFNAGRAGLSAVKRAIAARKLAKLADLGQEINVNDIAGDVDDVLRAKANGREVKVENDRVVVEDENGREKVLYNTDPEIGRQLSLFEWGEEQGGTGMDVSLEGVAERANVRPVRQPSADSEVEYYSNRQELDNALSDRGTRSATQYLLDAGLDDAEFNRRLESLPEPVQEAIRQQIDRYGNPGQYDYSSFRKAMTSGTSDIVIDNAMLKAADVSVDAPKIDTSAPKVETDTPKVDVSEVEIETRTPEGTQTVKVPDYRFTNHLDALKTKVVGTVQAAIKYWHEKALEVSMKEFNDMLREFRTRYGDVQPSDFHWVRHNIETLKKTPDQIIGTTDPTTGRMIDQNKLDAMKWWAEQPIIKDLRLASREGLGKEGDTNILGYLPHTNYDPSAVDLNEAIAGTLWKHSTGKAVVKDGQYVGYGGTFEGLGRTYISNMLWDAKSNDIATAAAMDEAALDGNKITPEQATQMVKGGKAIVNDVDSAKSSKDLSKAAGSDGGKGMEEYRKAAEQVEKDAPNSGVGQATHDNWRDMYRGANGSKVTSQPKSPQIALDAQGNTLRKISTTDGNLYDNGAADLVYASQNAFEIVNRIVDNGLNWRETLVNFVMNHSGRTRQYAEFVADRMLKKIISESGENITKASAIKALSKSFKSEAWSRMRRWLVRADYDNFDKGTKRFIDDFLFRHMQLDSYVNNDGIIKKLTNGMTNLRYKSLFYGNFKNALLQVSELNRLFTEFKIGDVASMIKRLATDPDFRAKVDTYVQAVAPESSFVRAAVYDDYGKLADSFSVDDDGVSFKNIKDAGRTIDKIATAPIETAEAIKNRTMVAALVAEADRLGYTGDTALMYIRQRFERVALAQNEMGRIGLASNPVAKPMLFLQNFQLRELGMHYYNIADPPELDGKVPKKTLEAAKYITKVLGTKMATTLILARLGYSASQTLGLDPFGVTGNYSRLSDDEKTWIDQQISNGFLTPFVSGGITSLLADMYFMAREAYEDANKKTISDEAKAELNRGLFGGLDLSAPFSGENLANTALGFVPGYTFGNRVNQMNQMMDTGWATSATGNKMYTAPDDAFNTALGYLFGRSATANAQQYNQTYGDTLGQTLGRTAGRFFGDVIPGVEYEEFDPIDKENYSDWFKGNDNDAQQFEKGRRYFIKKRDQILDAYRDATRNKTYVDQSEITEATNNMNNQLNDLFGQLDKFVDAYEDKNGPISSAMVKQIVNILNTGENVMEGTEEEREARSLEDYNKALRRYANIGLPAIGTYGGPTTSNRGAETKYQGSPQFRTYGSARYDINDEAAVVLKMADEKLAPIRKSLKDRLNDAYEVSDYDTVNAVQQEYLRAFDQVVSPIIAMYGNGILSSTDVTNQLKDMLSTGTSSRSGDLIPTEQYKKDKTGRFRSTPLETVDVKKWAQQRFRSDTYKNPTATTYSTAEEDINEIKRLATMGGSGIARARARALQLKARIENQTRAISERDYTWLNKFLKESK